MDTSLNQKMKTSKTERNLFSVYKKKKRNLTSKFIFVFINYIII